MKVVAFRKSSSPEIRNWLRQSYRLRADIFGRRLGWDVDVLQGQEVDIFDQLSAEYLVLLDMDDNVIGTVRFLPTDGPTMLTTVFADLLTNTIPLLPNLIEASRFCIDTRKVKNREVINTATRGLLAAMVEWALSRQYPSIAVVVDLRMERILRRAGWSLARSSTPQPMGKVIGMAGQLPVSQQILESLRPTGYELQFWNEPGMVLDCAS